MSNARNLANLLTGGDTTFATGDVANGAISTAKLADDAVTAAKIDDDGTGFQVSSSNAQVNSTSYDPYIYMAWADVPGKYNNAG